MCMDRNMVSRELSYWVHILFYLEGEVTELGKMQAEQKSQTLGSGSRIEMQCSSTRFKFLVITQCLISKETIISFISSYHDQSQIMCNITILFRAMCVNKLGKKHTCNYLVEYGILNSMLLLHFLPFPHPTLLYQFKWNRNGHIYRYIYI